MLPAIGFIKQETKSGEKHFFLIINLMYSVHSINMKPYFLFKVDIIACCVPLLS